jgi:hypothetical protein
MEDHERVAGIFLDTHKLMTDNQNRKLFLVVPNTLVVKNKDLPTPTFFQRNRHLLRLLYPLDYRRLGTGRTDLSDRLLHSRQFLSEEMDIHPEMPTYQLSIRLHRDKPSLHLAREALLQDARWKNVFNTRYYISTGNIGKEALVLSKDEENRITASYRVRDMWESDYNLVERSIDRLTKVVESFK